MKVDPNDFVKATVHSVIAPGEALRMLRELQGLTQAQLATLCGVAQANISVLETGQKHMGRDRALALAKVLKVHPAVLLFPDFDVNSFAA